MALLLALPQVIHTIMAHLLVQYCCDGVLQHALRVRVRPLEAG